MDRRRVLKKIGYGSAAMVVTPQIINMLHSCKSNVNKYLPIFFANNQFQFVSKIMDHVIPKTDIPGAIELKLPEFLDNYIVVVMNQEMNLLTMTTFVFNVMPVPYCLVSWVGTFATFKI